MRKSIYIAASIKDVDFAREVGMKLMLEDYNITSTWLDENFEGKTEDPMEDEKLCKSHALHCFYDIDRADKVLFLGGEHKSAGKNVEFGYAYARGKKIITVGKINSVFHHLANQHVNTVEEFLARERLGT